jgi:hypothetical protein
MMQLDLLQYATTNFSLVRSKESCSSFVAFHSIPFFLQAGAVHYSSAED